jgi:DNA-binding transcriptional LysR family regulator
MLDRGLLQAEVYVLAVAEEGSISRAARRLGTDKSFLTKQISTLETSLGVHIFERTPRGIDLTAAGKLVLPEIVTALRHAERALDLARYCGKTSRGPFRLGYSPYVNSAVLPALQQIDLSKLEARRMRGRDATEPRIHLETAVTPKLIERVCRGRLHAALGIHPVQDQDLWVETVSQEPFSICMPKNHLLAQRPSVAVRDMHGQLVFWIPRAAHPAFYDRTVEYIRSMGAEPVFHEVPSLAHAMSIVASGFGVALLPQSFARLAYAGVVFKTVADRLLQIETAIFARRSIMNGVLQELTLFVSAYLRATKSASR